MTNDQPQELVSDLISSQNNLARKIQNTLVSSWVTGIGATILLVLAFFVSCNGAAHGQ